MNATQLLTAAQVAQQLGVSLRFIYDQAKRGLLPSVRLGSSVRFLGSDVAAYIEARRTGGGREAA